MWQLLSPKKIDTNLGFYALLLELVKLVTCMVRMDGCTDNGHIKMNVQNITVYIGDTQ